MLDYVLKKRFFYRILEEKSYVVIRGLFRVSNIK